MNSSKKIVLLLFMFVAMAAFAFMASDAEAYQYFAADTENTLTNCEACHPSLTDKGDGHDPHYQNTGLGCSDCHGGGLANRDAPPLANCVQCHGRAEDDGGDGQIGDGLRAHHAWAGINECAGCHNDETPVGEDVLPPYYPGAANLDTCNGSEERFASETNSLDNDGDGLTDLADPDCAPPEADCFDGIDNDNDGLTDCADPDCDGQDNGPGSCTTGLPGICSAGTSTCTGGAEQCVQDNQPVTEDVASGNCGDGLDNDCDGMADTDPECQVVGQEVNCFDGLDNDDDGATDCEDSDCNNVMGPATTCGVGACAGNTGNLMCTGGAEVDTCDPFAGAAPDDSVCNGIDDDCDGPIDEDFVSVPTTCGTGACASTGQTECVDGVEGDTCMPGDPSPEICDDPGMVDEDCDGQANTSDPDCGGAVMPPPVRQEIGFFDGDITNFNANDCRDCHDFGNGPVDGVCSGSGASCTVDPDNPQSTCPVNETCLPILAKNRHHLLVDGTIVNGSLLFIPEISPPAWTDDADNDGTPDEFYACENCHPDDPGTPIIEFPVTRDCLVCHRTGSPHHSENVELAQEKRCFACHGDIVNVAPDACTKGGSTAPDGLCRVDSCSVSGTPCTLDTDCPSGETCIDTDECPGPDNFCGDGHVIPTYEPSLVTPWPSGKTNAGLPLNDYDDGAGQCIYCHNQDTMPPADPIEILTNMDTHHNTSLESQNKCTWCHPTNDGPNGDAFDIRVCEECHGFGSLHNIQADSTAVGLVDLDGDGIGDIENLGNIVAGAEDSYFGHVGNQDGCWGCHGFVSASAPGTGEITPSISGTSASTIIAGTNTTISVYGMAFTNTAGTSELLSNVVLTASDGSETVLAPDAITTTEIVVTIPGTTSAGTYDLRAVKGSVASNPIAIFITPDVVITSVTCKGKRLTINGSGFGETVPQASDYINIDLNGLTITDITSWSDTQIKARVSSCPSTSIITVNALFGADTEIVKKQKIKKPKK